VPVNQNWLISYTRGPPIRLLAMYAEQRNSVAFSLQANCTNWTTTTCQEILMPTFADRGVSHGQHADLSFLDWSRYFFFQVALHPLLLRKSDSTESRTQDLWLCSQELWTLDHRGGQSMWSGVWKLQRRTLMAFWKPDFIMSPQTKKLCGP
jgi:hypothetical protein